MRADDLHRTVTFGLSIAMAAVGVALIVQGVTGSAGGAVVRVIVGVLFVAAGAGRVYVLRRTAGRDDA